MNQAFIKHFNLNENDVKQAEAQLAQGFTLLESLFEKKMVDPVAYLTWAKDHYSLPILKPDFLEKNNNIENLLTRYKNVFPRCIIPFYEWDGVLYVMCLEPVEFKAPQPIQYILAPFEVIQKYITKSESKTTVVTKVDFRAETVEVTNPLFKTLSATTAEVPAEKLSLNFNDLEIPKLELTLEPDTSGAPETSEESDGAPAGLNFPEFKAEKPEYVSEKPVLGTDLKDLKFDAIKPAIASKPTEDSKTRIVDISSLIKDAQVPEAPMPAPVAKIPVTPPASVPPIPMTVQQPMSYKNIHDMMKKYFQQSMILSYQMGQLTPVSWDETWAKQAHSQSVIDLNTASIFRIVKETLKPYHGYIIQNPINNSFFQVWNAGKYPEHITICPIVENKNLTGMILGVTNKEGAKKYQLHHIEEIAILTAPFLRIKKAA